MRKIYFTRRIIFIMSILLICSDVMSQPGNAQLSPEPKVGFMAGQDEKPSEQEESGLLFYLSGDKDFTADFAAGGQVLPNYLKDVTIISDGAHGKGFRAEDTQLMSYWAPGNIYAQRGTLSFFWRSRYPVGPSPFPVFRVGYADHSSWDMVWLRIDYNGSGFDAFVTDIGLSRTRISWYMDKFPAPEEWIHIALSWDETVGIRFYLNGELVAIQSVNEAVYDSGLDQFGTHSRIISPYQVQSAYSFMRGGDIDELRIYDRILPDECIKDLAAGNAIKTLAPFRRDLAERRWRDAWWIRNGWNLPNSPPPLLPSSETSVRKVEIHDAYDIKRWYWKANDGIRETTWPGVYNMSRLPGRYDYFVLPDWDCYSGSGQSVKFTIPDEPWNHVEIWGKAWGQLTFEKEPLDDYTFGVRTRNQVKSYHHISEPQSGGKIRFDNALIEEPIGSFEVYNIEKGHAPEGTLSETFALDPVYAEPDSKALRDVVSFVRGRYPADERSMMQGVPETGRSKKSKKALSQDYSYPFIHIMIPYSGYSDSGLDGIEIKLPALNVRPTHNGLFPMNIRVKDPLWQMRDLADFSFSIRPGDSPVLWLDTRDRILPKGRALYITIAGAGADLTPDLLKGARIRLIYKPGGIARLEHEPDRFTQIRDLYAHIVEEHPNNPRLNLYNRLMADCNDLLSVNPDHWLAQAYRYVQTGERKPGYRIAECPGDIPEWAFLQIEYLRHLERLVSYYIDNRQIANGEFGGGLSDDGDLTNMWPGIAFLGINPEKILQSLLLHMKAYYDQDRSPEDAGLRQRSLPLFTNGLSTIFTDELHALEEGIQVVAQAMLLDYGNPLHIERGMETASRMLNDVTQVNAAGHRHFRSRYYGGTRMATEDPWQWSVNHSYNVLQTSYLTARYNGNPELRRMITEIADGLLEHSRDGTIYSEINFSTDKDRDINGRGNKPWSLLIAAWKLTGDRKYIEPLPAGYLNKREFNKERLAEDYRNEITNLGVREYINTEGSIWIDRISSFNPMIQQDRLGGVALTRVSVLYPQHFVSWKFNGSSGWQSVAIFLPKADSESLEIIAYNIDRVPVSAEMTLWDIKPGKWRVRQGIDTDDDQKPDSDMIESVVYLERGEPVSLVFAPRKYSIVTLALAEPAEKGYWELPDPGIGPEDVTISGNNVTIRVHNLGAIASAETTLELRDAKGIKVGTTSVPPIEAPLDLKPRRIDIKLNIPKGTDLKSGSVRLDPEQKLKQITRRNDTVKW
jgi:hypothetical protein